MVFHAIQIFLQKILHVNFIIVNPMSQSFAVPIGQPGVRVSPHLVHENEVAHRLDKRHWESDLLGKSLTSFTTQSYELLLKGLCNNYLEGRGLRNQGGAIGVTHN